MTAQPSAPEEEKPRRTTERTFTLAVTLIVGVLLIAASVAFVILPLLPARTAIESQSPMPSPTATGQSASPTPTSGPLRSALNARVLYAHDAVGADIASAVPAAYRSAQLPEPRTGQWSRVPQDKKPVFADVRVGKDGEPRPKLGAFAALVNDAPRGSIDIALMNFSYADISADSDVADVFSQYAATMQSLENAHPDIEFLYTTVPVTTENSWKEVDATKVTGLSGATQPVWQSNIARERYNALVRERFGSSGRLFDIAALEARIGNGRVAAMQHEGQWFYVMNPDLASSDGRRLNPTGSARLASELARMLGSLAKG